jgi:hypothetical protein
VRQEQQRADVVTDPEEEARIRHAVAVVRGQLLGVIGAEFVRDVVPIGTASDRYDWLPSRIVDFDAFVFVDGRGVRVGRALSEVKTRIEAALRVLGVDVEFRVIRGAYKPDRSAGQPPIVLAHLGVFAEEDYLREPMVHRWGWRKYRGVVEPGRLARLAPPRPSVSDLLDGERCVRHKLADLERGETTMHEWVLPELRLEERTYTAGDPVFTEFCHGAVATGARHHARLLGHLEADTLGNDDFFVWYSERLLRTDVLLPLMERKKQSRNGGFASLAAGSREAAVAFIRQLEATLVQLEVV